MSLPLSTERNSLLVCFVMAVAGGYFLISNIIAHYFISDDAYISFRYAQNLVNGYGLVWNHGEAVEGYTNFLWVVLIAAGMLISVPPEIAATVLSVSAAFILLCALTWQFSRSWCSTTWSG